MAGRQGKHEAKNEPQDPDCEQSAHLLEPLRYLDDLIEG
jgi:hypothetical protein